MSIALYLDVHVHIEITEALRRVGVDVITAQEDGARRLPDDQLLDGSTALGRVLFSRDADLLVEAAQRQTKGREFAGVIYAHQLTVTIGQCISDLHLLVECSDLEDMANTVVYLPFK